VKLTDTGDVLESAWPRLAIYTPCPSADLPPRRTHLVWEWSAAITQTLRLSWQTSNQLLCMLPSPAARYVLTLPLSCSGQDGVIGIGSGGAFATAAARALLDVPGMDAEVRANPIPRYDSAHSGVSMSCPLTRPPLALPSSKSAPRGLARAPAASCAPLPARPLLLRPRSPPLTTFPPPHRP
jgi:hypothetical protein